MDNAFDPKRYWDDRLKAHYDLVGVGDISLSMNYNIWSYRVSRHRLRTVFRRHVPAGAGAVLDIGSGTGFVVGIWDGLGKRVTGIDISATAVGRLRELFPSHAFLEADAGREELSLADGSVQCVSAASVLYHVIGDEDIVRVLRTVRRVLRPDGCFIFSEKFIHKGRFSITHQKCRTLHEYERLLAENGFEVVERCANYVLFDDPVDARGRLFPAIWSRLTQWSNRHRWFDALIWPLLYPLELLLTSVMRESPAQEIMVCRPKP